jgi:hypothetical protein
LTRLASRKGWSTGALGWPTPLEWSSSPASASRRACCVSSRRSSDSVGTIGIEAGKRLKRLPSAVYWGGLGTWGIRLFPGSQDQYHRSLDRFYRARETGVTLRENPEGQVFHGANWHPHIPDAPPDFLDESTFDLSKEEASYLQDLIQSRVGGSLIAFLVQRGEPWKHAAFPWDESLLDTYPDDLRQLVEHARCYSELMHGAALLYNLMLAEAVPSDQRIDEYQRRMAGWHRLLADREPEIRSCDQAAFWRLVDRNEARIPIPTRSFSSRRTMAQALGRVELIAAGNQVGAEDLPWAALRYEHTQAI